MQHEQFAEHSTAIVRKKYPSDQVNMNTLETTVPEPVHSESTILEVFKNLFDFVKANRSAAANDILNNIREGFFDEETTSTLDKTEAEVKKFVMKLNQMLHEAKLFAGKRFLLITPEMLRDIDMVFAAIEKHLSFYLMFCQTCHASELDGSYKLVQQYKLKDPVMQLVEHAIQFIASKQLGTICVCVCVYECVSEVYAVVYAVDVLRLSHRSIERRAGLSREN